MNFPVAILSFNRPDMLARVLESLVENRKLPDGDVGPIHLFQDGAVNFYSARRHASDDQIDACVATFKRLVPSGTVHRANGNMGVALAYERAEQFVFETLQAPAAIFLEDDLVLGKGYTQLLVKLISFALKNPAVGMVSCYGRSPTTPVAAQETHASRTVHMGQNWGFGLTRAHWRERRRLLLPYIDLIRSVDYRDRPHDQIAAWRSTLGGDPEPTSQDDCKNLVSLRLGRVRVSTYANFDAYIGKTGLHMDEEQFIKAGYPMMRQIPYDGFRMVFPSDRELSDILFCEVTARNLRDLSRAQSRGLDHTLVRAAYRLFLGREPESEGVISEKLRLQSAIGLLHDLLTCREYRNGACAPLDLSALVLNLRPSNDHRRRQPKGRLIDQDTVRVASKLFSITEKSIQEIAKRPLLRATDVLVSLFGSEEFRNLYAGTLGTKDYFLGKKLAASSNIRNESPAHYDRRRGSDNSTIVK